jgi:hypothetical protein
MLTPGGGSCRPNATSKDEEDERRAIEAIRIMKEEAST